jgi:hypothetical protein
VTFRPSSLRDRVVFVIAATLVLCVTAALVATGPPTLDEVIAANEGR